MEVAAVEAEALGSAAGAETVVAVARVEVEA